MKSIVVTMAVVLLMAGLYNSLPAHSEQSKDALQTSVLLKHNSRIMALEKRVDELERRLALHAKAIGNLAVKVAGK